MVDFRSTPTELIFGLQGDLPAALLQSELPEALLQAESDRDDAARLRESDRIASQLQVELAKRSPTRTMSPDWIAAQPTSMRAKLRVTPEEEETILFHFSSTSSIPQTASLAGVGVDKVRSVVYAPDLQGRLSSIRESMRISVIRKIEETQTILLDALQNPDKLKDSSLTQISEVLTKISETQLNLLNASRSPEAIIREVDPASIFSGDELEYMAFLRRRLSAPSAPRELSGPSQASPEDVLSLLPHECLDPVYDVSPSASEVDPAADSSSSVSEEAIEEARQKFFEIMDERE